MTPSNTIAASGSAALSLLDPRDPRTTSEFWDCECPGGLISGRFGYIHPRTEDECGTCGAVRTESPDSMLVEVQAMQEAQAVAL